MPHAPLCPVLCGAGAQIQGFPRARHAFCQFSFLSSLLFPIFPIRTLRLRKMLNSWVKVARANRQAQLATSHLFQNAGFIFLGHPNETPAIVFWAITLTLEPCSCLPNPPTRHGAYSLRTFLFCLLKSCPVILLAPSPILFRREYVYNWNLMESYPWVNTASVNTAV